MSPRQRISDKSRGLALALGVPLGVFGAHRFYVGKVGTGLLQLFTIGGFGLWWLYDMLVLVGGGFRDAEGSPVLRWDFEATGFDELNDRSDPLAVELEALRSEVAELHERVDFTERLLAQSVEERRMGAPARAADARPG